MGAVVGKVVGAIVCCGGEVVDVVVVDGVSGTTTIDCDVVAEV